MTPDLPAPIAAYFHANRTFDVDAMLAPFASDALVHDERNDHRGTEHIRAWIEQATVANKAVATPLSMEREGDQYRVAAEVAGAFPGSPVMLTFAFTLNDAAISALEIA